MKCRISSRIIDTPLVLSLFLTLSRKRLQKGIEISILFLFKSICKQFSNLYYLPLERYCLFLQKEIFLEYQRVASPLLKILREYSFLPIESSRYGISVPFQSPDQSGYRCFSAIISRWVNGSPYEKGRKWLEAILKISPGSSSEESRGERLKG